MTTTSTDTQTPELRPEHLAAGEPLLSFLTGSRIPAVIIAIIYTLVFDFARGLAALQAGCLLSDGDMLGFLDDPALLTNFFFGSGIILAYVWIPKGIVAVFKGLADNKVIDSPTDATREAKGEDYSYADFTAEMQTMFAKRLWSWTALGIAIVVPVIMVLPGYLRFMQNQTVCQMSDGFNVALSLLWVIFGLYAFLVMLVYCMLGIYWINKLFRSFNVIVRPFHPDRAGGLFPLGNFALKLSYLITLVGFIIVLTSITRYYARTKTFGFAPEVELIAALGVYLVLAPVVFFVPLAAAYTSMKKAKSQLLLEIDESFTAKYNDIRTALKDDNSLEDSLKKLEELQTLHDMTRRFPVWPFSAASLRQFSTSWVAPIVLAVLAEVLTNLINQ